MAIVAMTILEARPKPNHSASSGAMAKTGIAWLTTITGSRTGRVSGRKLMASARPAPSTAPGDEADHASRSGSSPHAPATGPAARRSAANTRAGSGSMKGGGWKIETIACQMTSSATATPSALQRRHRPSPRRTDRAPPSNRPLHDDPGSMAKHLAEKSSRPFAGMTRIRFEGFGLQAISARERAPLGTGGELQACRPAASSFRNGCYSASRPRRSSPATARDRRACPSRR